MNHWVWPFHLKYKLMTFQCTKLLLQYRLDRVRKIWIWNICRNWYEIQKHYHKMSFHIFPLLKILKERWGFEEQYFSWITVFEFWFQFCSNSKTCTICTSHFACGSHRLRFHLWLQQCCWNHFGNHRCIWTRFFYYYLYPYEDLGCLPKKCRTMFLPLYNSNSGLKHDYFIE